jgi:hypothetical protein
MPILVACEESQVVTTELRKLGLIAFSCDLQPTSGNHPEWHIQGDVIPILSQYWDMIIAFPPCTHLAVSGAKWFKIKREDGRQQQGIDFFLACVNANSPRIAIENPIGIMSSVYKKPSQIIQPWMFGHPETKATCLWLKNLPPLNPTNNVYNEFKQLPRKQQHRIHFLPPSINRSKIRSKTYPNIAKAMAHQWGSLLLYI